MDERLNTLPVAGCRRLGEVIPGLFGAAALMLLVSCANSSSSLEDEIAIGIAPGLLDVLEGDEERLLGASEAGSGVEDVEELMAGSALPTMLDDIEGDEHFDGMNDGIMGFDDDDLPQPQQVTGWFRSAYAGIYRAQMLHLPIVFWFGHSGISAPDRLLDEELFGRPEFKEILQTNAVGIRVDFADTTTQRSSYYQHFRKRYDIRGFPTVLILRPGGQEVERFFGYRDGAEGFQRNILVGLAKADRQEREWLKQLESSGFRWWTNREGVRFFAQVLHRNESEVILREAHGRRYRVPLDSFSAQSLAYILEETTVDAKDAGDGEEL